MKWTKAHSANAVAAKARKRMAEATAEPELPAIRRQHVGRLPLRSRARFTVQVRDHGTGESLTLNLHQAPWPNRYCSKQGEFSAAHIGRAIGLILTGPPPPNRRRDAIAP